MAGSKKWRAPTDFEPIGKRTKIEHEAALEKSRKRQEAEMRALEEKEALERDGMRWSPKRQ
ncbi:hypothetical protein [Pseudonocardia cypriaca]|uniref:Uncharacterized protein n=1 Tax=Pseudonocardia cypriaca TaxID=882449 RepID=A0A543GDF9_9PSEU|nr:hypothetical protein [Pseudonocardia cypriaca]TQM44111.1 hypothetical protein FB388_1473 [Pseudonocardia cypriaca]